MKMGSKKIASILIAATAGTFGANSIIAGASGTGFGFLVGYVGPCHAEQFDAQPSEPLIIILTKSNRTFETYNVSADPGTSWYHFDIPAGRYELSTTWWGSRDYRVTVGPGKTIHVNFKLLCGPSST